MRIQIELLESRRLLSHTLPTELFAQPTDRYLMQIGGDGLPFTEITGLNWAVEAPEGGPIFMHDFGVVLPAGPASPLFFQWAVSGQILPGNVEIRQGISGQASTLWVLSGNPFVTSYAQSLGSDGVLYDFVSFTFQRLFYRFTAYPLPSGNAVPATLDWNFATNSGTASPLAATRYMSTSPDVPATIEFGSGQLAVNSYNFAITGGPGAPPVDFAAVSSLDGPPLLGTMLNRARNDFVYLQRDAQARPLARSRFIQALPVRYSFSDTTLDDLPRSEAWSFLPNRAQIIGYDYTETGDMKPPVSSGWNFQNAQLFNPPPVTAFIKPPTFGPTNAPLDSVQIHFTHAVTNLTLAHLDFEPFAPAAATLTMFDGGLRWTIGNLAPMQGQDGDYAVKLFALGSGLASGGNPLIGSTGIKWTLDTVAPSVIDARFEFLTSQSLRFSFSEDVGTSLSIDDITLTNLTNSTTIPSAAMALVYDPTTNVATITFPGLANGTLPDGNYRATLASAGVSDAAGNLLLADHSLEFFFLNGDANRDGRVNLADFNILAANFGQSNRTFSHGDFNYDGAVNLADFNILASRFGQALGPDGQGGLSDQRPPLWVGNSRPGVGLITALFDGHGSTAVDAEEATGLWI